MINYKTTIESSIGLTSYKKYLLKIYYLKVSVICGEQRSCKEFTLTLTELKGVSISVFMVVDSKNMESLLRRVAKRNKAISPTFYLFISFYLFLTIRTTAMSPFSGTF